MTTIRTGRRKGPAPKLSPDVKDSLVRLIKTGCPIATAALGSGISARTFYDYMAKGRKAKSGIFRELADAVDKAQAEAEATLVMQVRSHGKKDWRAPAWILERRFPERWKQHKAVEATVIPDGASAPLIIELRHMSPEQLKALSGVDLDGMGLPTDPMGGRKAIDVSPVDTDTDTDTDTDEE